MGSYQTQSGDIVDLLKSTLRNIFVDILHMSLEKDDKSSKKCASDRNCHNHTRRPQKSFLFDLKLKITKTPPKLPMNPDRTVFWSDFKLEWSEDLSGARVIVALFLDSDARNVKVPKTTQINRFSPNWGHFPITEFHAASNALLGLAWIHYLDQRCGRKYDGDWENFVEL